MKINSITKTIAAAVIIAAPVIALAAGVFTTAKGTGSTKQIADQAMLNSARSLCSPLLPSFTQKTYKQSGSTWTATGSGTCR